MTTTTQQLSLLDQCLTVLPEGDSGEESFEQDNYYCTRVENASFWDDGECWVSDRNYDWVRLKAGSEVRLGSEAFNDYYNVQFGDELCTNPNHNKDISHMDFCCGPIPLSLSASARSDYSEASNDGSNDGSNTNSGTINAISLSSLIVSFTMVYHL